MDGKVTKGRGQNRALIADCWGWRNYWMLGIIVKRPRVVPGSPSRDLDAAGFAHASVAFDHHWPKHKACIQNTSEVINRSRHERERERGWCGWIITGGFDFSAEVGRVRPLDAFTLQFSKRLKLLVSMSVTFVSASFINRVASFAHSRSAAITLIANSASNGFTPAAPPVPAAAAPDARRCKSSNHSTRWQSFLINNCPRF
jgi:hypothetical protein